MLSMRIGDSTVPYDGVPSLSLRFKLEAEKPIAGRGALQCSRCKQTEFSSGERSLARCGKCKLAFYCSTTCQQEDWSVHKEICKQIGQLHKIAEKTKARFPVDLASVPTADWFSGPPRKKKCDCTRLCEVGSCACRRDDYPCDPAVCACKHGPISTGCGNERKELSACAATNFDRVAALSAEQLAEKQLLPCCGAFKTFMNLPEAKPAAYMTTKELLNSPHECPNCHDDGEVFYSFCLSKPAFVGICPGSVRHCEECGRCSDYMSSHCETCHRCYYGQLLPCMWCHELVALADGIHAFPKHTGKCDAFCKCDDGKSPFDIM
eukprot:TRINITY_DN11410_c0_g1_i1.p1 TRINITY_DN11410_c0_g1~~TRINITY_DN11410_c0_g1_i1.p1  ORF type:complete len:321 (-),score=9.07 TRINITY_DN11410_c0_g1_i1:86-1048(-)